MMIIFYFDAIILNFPQIVTIDSSPLSQDI